MFFQQSYQESDILEAPTTEFQWINIENLTEFRACRNSIQGASLIVDERGEELFLLIKCLSEIAKASVHCILWCSQ